jgi:hypothetical protein
LWWLLAGYLLEILREPLRAFLLEIAQQTGSAIGSASPSGSARAAAASAVRTDANAG